jgi:hypothetical protein
MPEKTSSPAKDNPLPKQDTSSPDVHMDTGAQEDAPDTGANASGARTAENVGASNKSADIDKGKGPEVPEIRTEPAPIASGQATPAAPEKSAPKAPAPEKTAATPAKTGAPTMSPAPAPTKATPTFKMTQIIKEKSITPPASSAMTLHTSKGASRVSSFHTPELEGRVSLWTKSDNSLGSLKEYCMKWNDANFVDIASSSKMKALAETLTAGTQTADNPPAIPAKPIAIASELFSIQQRLYHLAEATNVSIHPYTSPVPENAGCATYRHPGFFNNSLTW